MRSKKRKIFASVSVALILLIGFFVFMSLPKSLAVSDSAYNLSQTADGIYLGRCDNGIVKVQVEVDVRGGEITSLRIAEHQNGLGSPAEAIIDDVVRKQCIEVDVVSGATMSSKTILKAVENALSGAGE